MRETLTEYDFSVRARLASSSLCGGSPREPSVALKLQLRRADADGGGERHVMLELDAAQLAQLLDACAAVSKVRANASTL